jgi:hypothetical protein
MAEAEFRRPEPQESKASDGNKECRITVRRRKGPAFGLARSALFPRRSGMQRAGGVFPEQRKAEPRPEEPAMAELCSRVRR